MKGVSWDDAGLGATKDVQADVEVAPVASVADESCFGSEREESVGRVLWSRVLALGSWLWTLGVSSGAPVVAEGIRVVSHAVMVIARSQGKAEVLLSYARPEKSKTLQVMVRRIGEHMAIL